MMTGIHRRGAEDAEKAQRLTEGFSFLSARSLRSKLSTSCFLSKKFSRRVAASPYRRVGFGCGYAALCSLRLCGELALTRG